MVHFSLILLDIDHDHMIIDDLYKESWMMC